MPCNLQINRSALLGFGGNNFYHYCPAIALIRRNEIIQKRLTNGSNQSLRSLGAGQSPPFSQTLAPKEAQMTIRKYINTRKRLANLSLYGGLLISAAAAKYLLKQDDEPPIFIFAGALIGFAAMALIKTSTKCPACKGNLGSTLMDSGSFVSLSKKVKYCPLCGTSVDKVL